MPRATIMREAVEAYKREIDGFTREMGGPSTAQVEREGALRARIAMLEADLKATRAVQVNATTTTAGTVRFVSDVQTVQRDPQSFEAFVEMMGFCEDCQRDIKSYLEQYHLSHQWLIRKAINGLFSWAPHAESCPKPAVKAVEIPVSDSVSDQ